METEYSNLLSELSKISLRTVPLPTPDGPEKTISNPRSVMTSPSQSFYLVYQKKADFSSFDSDVFKFPIFRRDFFFRIALEEQTFPQQKRAGD